MLRPGTIDLVRDRTGHNEGHSGSGSPSPSTLRPADRMLVRLMSNISGRGDFGPLRGFERGTGRPGKSGLNLIRPSASVRPVSIIKCPVPYTLPRSEFHGFNVGSARTRFAATVPRDKRSRGRSSTSHAPLQNSAVLHFPEHQRNRSGTVDVPQGASPGGKRSGCRRPRFELV